MERSREAKSWWAKGRASWREPWVSLSLAVRRSTLLMLGSQWAGAGICRPLRGCCSGLAGMRIWRRWRTSSRAMARLHRRSALLQGH